MGKEAAEKVGVHGEQGRGEIDGEEDQAKVCLKMPQ